MDNEKRKEVIEMIKHLSYFFDKYKDKLCEPYGLSSIQSKLILDVYHNEGTRVTDICKRLNKETNTISPLINRLIKHGYLTKIQDDFDKRITLIYLTDKSKQVMADLMKDVEKATLPLFDKLNEEELCNVYKSLKILERVYNEWNIY